MKRARTIELLQQFSIPLILGVIVAVVWANVDPTSLAMLLHTSIGVPELTFHFVVNELFMALFFGIATKEIAEACFPGGALNPVRKAINPLIATAGGVLGPALVFLAWAYATNDTAIVRGWGIPTATDIALAWLVARVVFGKGHPAVSFLLLLAIADDGIGLAIIAIFYPDPSHPVQPLWLLLVAAAMAGAFAMRSRRVYAVWPYLLAGVVSWTGLYFAHLHPALALVPIVPFMPHASQDEGLFEAARIAEAPNTMGKFADATKLSVDLGLFAFGLANAGVPLSELGNASYAVLVALAVGKTVGVTLGALLARALGFPLPDGIRLRDLIVLGMNAGLGLTVALFVAGVAFPEGPLQSAAKMGALLSALMGPATFVVAKIVGVESREHAAKLAGR